MRLIKVEEAIGTVLCHDLTQILPGVFKGAKFKKGHIIKEEDIPILLSMGKKNLYVYEVDETVMHEEDAARVLASLCKNEYMDESEVCEGKIELYSTINGFLEVDKVKLKNINMQDEIMIATIKEGNVEVGTHIAGMRVIPLVIKKEKLEKAKSIAGNKPILKINPYKIKNFGMVVTGSEVYNHIIDDKFSPIVEKKLRKYDVQLVEKIYVDDDKEMIKSAIKKLKASNAEMILVTGGMSVDPDDVTPSAIMESNVNIISYGSPLLPGAMLLIGYFDDETPILGLPGCVMYSAATVFDVVLPQVLAKIKWTKDKLSELAYGGLCQKCTVCHYPNCTFGN